LIWTIIDPSSLAYQSPQLCIHTKPLPPNLCSEDILSNDERHCYQHHIFEASLLTIKGVSRIHFLVVLHKQLLHFGIYTRLLGLHISLPAFLHSVTYKGDSIIKPEFWARFSAYYLTIGWVLQVIIGRNFTLSEVYEAIGHIGRRLQRYHAAFRPAM
jgi:hypothetical protein